MSASMTRGASNPEQLTLSLLGTLQATYRGAPLRSPDGTPLPRKSIALLAYLALENRPVPRRELRDLFWPDGHSANLRVALSRLRACEGSTAWLVDGEKIAVRAASDLSQFERALAERDYATALAIWGTPTDPRSHVMAGAENLRLPAELIEFWLEPLRARAFDRYLEALFQRASQLEADSEWEGALDLTLELLHHDPLDESALQRAMRLHSHRDDHQAALVLFERARRRHEAEALPPLLAETTAVASAARAALEAKARARAPVAVAPLLVDHPTAFVGRDSELAELERLVDAAEGRLVTIVGPGGAGKSRLAFELARRRADVYPDGAVVVPLDSIGEPGAVTAALAAAFGLPASAPDVVLERLVERVQAKNQLIVLDNFEHVLEAASVVDRLAAAGGGAVVVTSRVPLGLRREQLFELGGLGYPTEAEDPAFEEHDAVRLFTRCAQRVKPGFQLEEGERAAVVELCEFVGGLPLYIEHLASWTRLLSPAAILEELQTGPELFETTHQDLPERHRRLDLVLRQSLAMVPEKAKKTLIDLAYFRSGFTREAARQVAAATITDLRTLADASFVRLDQARFKIHEAVRAFLIGQLADGPDIGRRHAEFYLERSQAMTRDIEQGQAHLWRDDFEAERNNYLQALEWAERSGERATSARLMAQLGASWTTYGYFLDGLRFLEPLAEASTGETPDERRSLVHLGSILRLLGDKKRSAKVFERVLEMARSAGDERSEAHALGGLGAVAILDRRLADAEMFYRTSLDIADRLGNAHLAGNILNNLALVASNRGEREEAAELYERALSLQRRTGNLVSAAITVGNLAMTRHTQGQLDSAAAHYVEAIQLHRDLGARDGLRINLSNLGVLHSEAGRYEEAISVYREALELARQTGSKLSVARSLGLLAGALRLHGDSAAALPLFEECVAIYEDHGDEESLASVLNNMAFAAPRRDDQVELFERAVALARKVGRLDWAHVPLANLALLATEDGEFDRAQELLAESIAITESLTLRNRAVQENVLALSLAAYLAGSQGEFERALKLFAYDARVRVEAQAPAEPQHAARMEEMRTTAREALGPARSRALEQAGAAMTHAEVRALALSASGSSA